MNPIVRNIAFSISALVLLSSPCLAQIDVTSVSGPISQSLGTNSNGSNSGFAPITSTEVEAGASDLTNPNAREMGTDSIGADITLTTMSPNMDRTVTVPGLFDNSQSDAAKDVLQMTGARSYYPPYMFAVRAPTHETRRSASLLVPHPASTNTNFQLSGFSVSTERLMSVSFQPEISPLQSSQVSPGVPFFRQQSSPSLPQIIPGQSPNIPAGFSNKDTLNSPYLFSSDTTQRRTHTRLDVPSETSSLHRFSLPIAETMSQAQDTQNWTNWNIWAKNYSISDGAALFEIKTLGAGTKLSPDIVHSGVGRNKASFRGKGTMDRKREDRLLRLDLEDHLDARKLYKLSNRGRLSTGETVMKEYNGRRPRHHNPLLDQEGGTENATEP